VFCKVPIKIGKFFEGEEIAGVVSKGFHVGSDVNAETGQYSVCEWFLVREGVVEYSKCKHEGETDPEFITRMENEQCDQNFNIQICDVGSEINKVKAEIKKCTDMALDKCLKSERKPGEKPGGFANKPEQKIGPFGSI